MRIIKTEIIKAIGQKGFDKVVELAYKECGEHFKMNSAWISDEDTRNYVTRLEVDYEKYYEKHKPVADVPGSWVQKYYEAYVLANPGKKI